MSSDHLSLEILGALADGELSPRDNAVAQAHLNECNDCSRRALETYKLRSAVRHAAFCNAPSAEILTRLSAQLKPVKKQRPNWISPRALVWQAIAALFLVAFILGGWQWMRQSNSLTAEVLDQHLATLSQASAPEVVSSDRHTVKPWFEGKLPFSFNLPEGNALPPDTVLTGADLAYIHGRPAALLFFTIHKHRISVFVSQTTPASGLLTQRTRSGFQFITAKAAGLEFLGVGDVNAKELDALVQSLAAVQ